MHLTSADWPGVTISPLPGMAAEYRGSFFYYATELRAVSEIDEPGFVLLSGALAGDPAQRTFGKLSALGGEFTDQWALSRLQEYEERGFFIEPLPVSTVDNLAERTKRTLLRHQPYRMMLYLAQSCNLHCSYCYGIDRNYDDQGLRMTEARAVQAVDWLLDSAPGRRHFYIYFFGGEPLSNLPVMRDTVAHAKARVADLGKTVEFGLTTNGTLLSDEVCEFLVEEDFQVVVSLDGKPGAHDLHRKTRNGVGSYDAAVEGLRRILARSQRRNQVKIRATMTRENCDPLAIASHFERQGFRKFGIGSAVTRAGAPSPPELTGDNLNFLQERFEQLLEDVLEKLDEGQPTPIYNPLFRSAWALTRGYSVPGIHCGVCRNDQGVGVDGAIYPCHRFVGLEAFKIGHLDSGKDRHKVAEFYSSFFEWWKRYCRECWARYLCAGGCIWQHCSDGGEMVEPDDANCDMLRRSVVRSLWLHLHLAREHGELFARLLAAPAMIGGGGDERGAVATISPWQDRGT